MDPVNINLASREQLKTLPGCSKVIASEIIQKQKALQHNLMADDIKAITKLLANYWQQWLDEGMVTFEAPDGPQSPKDESELLASGSRTPDQSVLNQTQEGQDNTSIHLGDGYNGLQLPAPTHAPAKSAKYLPSGSVHS